MNIEKAESFHMMACYVCNNAGQPIMFWPSGYDSAASGLWHGYLKVDRDRWVGRPERSRHAVIAMCNQHWLLEAKFWEMTARHEVELEDIFHEYINRKGK